MRSRVALWSSLTDRLPAEIGRRLLLLVAVSFAPLFLLFAWNSWRDYRGFQAAQIETQVEVARGVASAFVAFLQEVSQTDRAIAAQAAGLTPAAAERLLRAEAAQAINLRSLSWTDPEGRVIASSDAALAGRRLKLPALKADTIIGDLEEVEPAQFSIVTPLRRDGALIGCVVARMDAEALGRVIFSVARPPGGAYSIFDAQGVLVYRSPPAPLDWPSRRAWRVRDARLNQVLATRQPQAGVETDQPLPGLWLVARFPASDSGWVAGASQPLANTLVPLRRREAEAWLLAMLVALAALAAAWRVGLTVSRPLARLEADARIGGPALRAPDRSGAPREIRQLRAALATMAEGLEERTARLRASEEKFRALFEQAAVGMGRLALPELRWIDVNDAFARMLGYTPDALCGTLWSESAFPDNHDSDLLPHFAAGELSGYTIEKRFRHHDGHALWTRLTLSLLRSEGGPECGVAVIENIDERKKAEEDLRLSEEKFAKAFNSNPAAISLSRLEDGRYTDVNATWSAMFGYTREEAIGRTSQELGIWPERSARERMVQSLDKAGAFREYEQTVRRRSGELVTVLGSAEIVTVAGERLALFSILDITDRKRTEEALRESEERFRVAQELLPDGFSILRPLRDADGHITDFAIVFMNGAAGRFVSLDPERAVGHSLLELMPGSRDWSNRALYREVAETRRPGLGETGVQIGGRKRWFRFAVVPLATDIAVLSQDITERKQAEEERERLIRELRRSNTELQQFAYISSHDLQEPLRMVASYVQLLERKYKGRLDDQADKYITYAVDGAHRMQKLIEGLLAYSRIGTRGAEFRRVEMNQVFDAAISNLSLAIRDSGAEVTRADLPPVSGDETQLLQLLQNLLGNAIKFRRTGVAPVVRVSSEQKGGEWQFAVSDNGIGIAPEYFERIFQIFQRLHTREEYPGTGIGLALVRRIVDRHRGRIWVESVPGSGTTFYFTLPESQP